jgi:hypothetical protein
MSNNYDLNKLFDHFGQRKIWNMDEEDLVRNFLTQREN